VYILRICRSGDEVVRIFNYGHGRREMATDADPIVSNWYQHLDKGQKFQIVAFNEGESVIEIQYFDGDIEEIDIDDWYLMDLEKIESPEDISGALDVSELDDLGSSITDTNPDDWDTPVNELKVLSENDNSTDIGESVDAEGATSYEEPWDEI
jgi:hypothetical protein